MTILKAAIEKAIEGGWLFKGNNLTFDGVYGDFFYLDDGGEAYYPQDAEIALDPLFWQALGRALGWENVSPEKAPWKFPTFKKAQWWEVQAHRFYDLILTGGDTEEFWSELLKDK